MHTLHIVNVDVIDSPIVLVKFFLHIHLHFSCADIKVSEWMNILRIQYVHVLCWWDILRIAY